MFLSVSWTDRPFWNEILLLFFRYHLTHQLFPSSATKYTVSVTTLPTPFWTGIYLFVYSFLNPFCLWTLQPFFAFSRVFLFLRTPSSSCPFVLTFLFDDFHTWLSLAVSVFLLCWLNFYYRVLFLLPAPRSTAVALVLAQREKGIKSWSLIDGLEGKRGGDHRDYSLFGLAQLDFKASFVIFCSLFT